MSHLSPILLHVSLVPCLAPCLSPYLAPCLAPDLGFSVPTKMLQFKVPTTMREHGVRGGETRSETRGETRSETMARQGWDKWNEIILGFRVPTTCETGGVTESETGGETGGKTGSKTGSVTGGKTWGETGRRQGVWQGARRGEMGRDKFMLGFRVPTTCSKKKFD